MDILQEDENDTPYCDCDNISSDEEYAINKCSCCGKMLETPLEDEIFTIHTPIVAPCVPYISISYANYEKMSNENATLKAEIELLKESNENWKNGFESLRTKLAEREQPPASKGLVAIPKGYVLVPLQLTKEMELVLEDEWQWEDLLAAAGSITEEQYQQASMKV